MVYQPGVPERRPAADLASQVEGEEAETGERRRGMTARERPETVAQLARAEGCADTRGRREAIVGQVGGPVGRLTTSNQVGSGSSNGEFDRLYVRLGMPTAEPFERAHRL
jgi:hypothetical protein